MEENIGTTLAHVSRLMRRRFDARSRGLGLTRPQWQTLSILRRNEGIKQGGLAEILEVEPISAGRMIDRLQDAGLVERRSDPTDRRAWRLHLTEKGEKLSDELRPYAFETLEEALTGIDAGERAKLLATLERIRSNLLRKSERGSAPED